MAYGRAPNGPLWISLGHPFSHCVDVLPHACLQALEEKHPPEGRFLLWSAEHMADKLAVASAARGAPVALAVVDDVSRVSCPKSSYQ